MGVITALEVQKRNKERVNIYLDGTYAFSLAMVEAAQLKKGQALSDQEISELQATDRVHQAVDQAARFLSYRPRSISEVKENLQKKAYDETVIALAIERLERLGYVDDRAFARYWCENRDTFKPRGARALRFELRQKGISDAIIQDVLADFEETDAAYRAAADKARRLRGKDRETFRKKISSYLQRRGFNYATTRDVLTQLENELAEEDFFPGG
jgi:regulatory protein